MKRKYPISILLLAVSNLVFGQFYIRYNNLGYSPTSNSRSIIILSNDDLKGEEWTISNSTTVLKKDIFDISLSSVGLHTPFPYNYKIDFTELEKIDSYTFKLKDSTIDFKIDTGLYSFIPSDILRYFRVQRSGSKDCLDHKISHKGDKRCIIHRRKDNKNDDWGYIDALPKKMNLRGGWYDAGDYIKFTLTTAYSSYLILKAYELNPGLFQEHKYSKTTHNDLLDEASWGLDYLLKTYQDTTEFIIQVGGHKDHQQGDRLPEYDELNGQRECYSGFSPTQMGYTAGALALGAQVFETEDSIRSKKYKNMAISIYNRAKHLNKCLWVKQGWETFYADKTPYDNLMLAAYELYKLTDDSKYKSDALRFSELSKQSYWSSWGSCNPLVQNMMQTNYGKQDSDFFTQTAKTEGNIWELPHKYTWSSLYSFMGVANAKAIQSINTNEMDKSVWNVLDYTLGKNNWGMAFVCSDRIPNSIQNVYSQIYKLDPNLKPKGAIAEGPGDRATHEQLKQYFAIPQNYPLEKFNSTGAVFYDLNTNFQTMETTIVGLAEGLLFFSLIDKIEKVDK